MKRKKHLEEDDDDDKPLVKKSKIPFAIKYTALPEYKQTRRQLALKFQNRRLGSDWMTILDRYLEWPSLQSIEECGLNMLQNCIGNRFWLDSRAGDAFRQIIIKVRDATMTGQVPMFGAFA